MFDARWDHKLRGSVVTMTSKVTGKTEILMLMPCRSETAKNIETKILSE